MMLYFSRESGWGLGSPMRSPLLSISLGGKSQVYSFRFTPNLL